MQKLLFSALAISLFITACKKSETPTGFEDPVFVVTYQEDTILDKTISAGLDGIYLFTRYSTDDTKYKSISTFTDANCPNGDCPGSLSFEFNHRIGVDSAFSGGSYKYISPDSLGQSPDYYDAIFALNNAPNNFSHYVLTLFGNDTTSYTYPGTSSNLNFLNLPNYTINIKLESFDNNGLYGAIYRTYFPGNLEMFPGVSIVATANGNGYNLQAVEDFTGMPVISYAWNTGDSSQFVLTDSLNFDLSYSVTVTDIFGNTASATIQSLPFPATTSIKLPQLTASVDPVVLPKENERIAIQWVDANGQVWRSDMGEQSPGSSFFRVFSAEPYESNEIGNRTKKLLVSFRCLLYTTGSQSRWFEGEGVIALAYP